MIPCRRATLDTPVGLLTLIAGDAGLRAILWPDDDLRRVPLPSTIEDDGDPMLAETARQLGEYFAGDRTAFDLPLDPQGTDFQRAVWTALRAIPYGGTMSYGAVAQAIGRADAVRAVGAANGRNPISIVIPCHRVIGGGGALTGFAGGLAAKRHLLAMERGEALLL